MKIKYRNKEKIAKGDWSVGFSIYKTDFLERTIWITICLLKIKILIEIGE